MTSPSLAPVVAVPVFGRLDALRLCLGSIDRCTDPAVEVLVIDDRGSTSPDEALLAELLGPSGRPWRLERNDRNLGFVGSANRAFELTAGHDVVLVNSDVTVFPGWLDGLVAAAGSGPDVASATALGDEASILTVPTGASPAVEVAARIAAQTDIAAQIPAAVGHCVYLRRDALTDVGGFDLAFSPGYGEEVDWSLRARRRGWRHVAALRTFVTHAGGSSFGTGSERDRLRRAGELRLLRRYPAEFARIRVAFRGGRNPLTRKLAELGESPARTPRPDVRVLLDGTAIPADRRGVGRYVEELVRHLPAVGVDLHLAVQPRDVEHFSQFLPADRLHAAPATTQRRPARLAWEQAGLPLLVHRTGVEVLHSPHYTMPLAATVPVLVTLHDATFFTMPEVHEPAKARFFRSWTRVAVRRAAGLVAPSQATADEVHRLVGGQPVHVVPHGVDHWLFRPPTAAEVTALREQIGVPGRYVAFLGTLEPRKNIPALIRGWVSACEGLPEPPALVLAGGSGWDRTLDAAVATVPPHLTLVRPGFLPDALLPALLGGASVVAYPALGEGFGLPVLEAMACGALVVTTRMLALPEVGGDAVLYADSPGAADLGSALRAALAADASEAGEGNALRAAAVARAAGFTWDRTAAEHARLYAAAARGTLAP